MRACLRLPARPWLLRCRLPAECVPHVHQVVWYEKAVHENVRAAILTAPLLFGRLRRASNAPIRIQKAAVGEHLRQVRGDGRVSWRELAVDWPQVQFPRPTFRTPSGRCESLLGGSAGRKSPTL